MTKKPVKQLNLTIVTEGEYNEYCSEACPFFHEHRHGYYSSTANCLLFGNAELSEWSAKFHRCGSCCNLNVEPENYTEFIDE